MIEQKNHAAARDFEATQFFSRNIADHSFNTAFSAWNPVLQALLSETQPSTVLEIGGGRSPSFYGFESNAELVVNDVSAHELSLLPPDVRRAQFDVSQPKDIPAELKGSVDLVFSRSVMEHVSSVDAAMLSTYQLLKPGGVALHFFPTLYASPFVINKIVPFWMTEKLVSIISKPQYERFPALYNECTSTHRQLTKWKNFGFRTVTAQRFYGHNYYARIPLVSSLQKWVADLSMRRGVSWNASFAYVLCVK